MGTEGRKKALLSGYGNFLVVHVSLHRRRAIMSSVGFLGLGGNAMAVGLHQIDLHSAAKMDDTIAVMRLLKEGFNVDKRDPYG